jgi:hypothetical protein
VESHAVHVKQVLTGANKTNLGAVAMRDNHIPTFLNHIHDVLHRVIGSIKLVLNRLMCFIFNQRVAPHRDTAIPCLSIRLISPLVVKKSNCSG